MAQSHLRNVARVRARLRKLEAELERAVLAALDSGESLRDIAPHAEMSYTRVHALVQKARRERQSDL